MAAAEGLAPRVQVNPVADEVFTALIEARITIERQTRTIEQLSATAIRLDRALQSSQEALGRSTETAETAQRQLAAQIATGESIRNTTKASFHGIGAGMAIGGTFGRWISIAWNVSRIATVYTMFGTIFAGAVVGGYLSTQYAQRKRL
jgi:hypothetical protein